MSRIPELPDGPPDSRDVLDRSRSDSGLDGSVEIRDLLHYMADQVLHCVEAFGANEKVETGLSTSPTRLGLALHTTGGLGLSSRRLANVGTMR